MDRKAKEKAFYITLFSGAFCLLLASALTSIIMGILVLVGGILILVGVGIMADLH